MSIRIRYILIMILVLVVTFCGLVQAVPRSDNFDDNSKGSMWGWFWIGEGPSTAWLDETNQRLEFRATSEANDNTAVYGSVGWGVVTADDFQIKINYHHSGIAEGNDFSQVFLVIIDTLNFINFPQTGNYIQFGAAYSGSNRIFYYRRGYMDTVYDSAWKLRNSDSGTLHISYNASLDELYISDIGYGSANAWKTITGIIQDQWNRNTVGVGFGGNSKGVELISGQAHLDNFVIDSGTLCDGLSEADLNEDCKVDFSDFALFAAEWLDCNMDPQSSCW